MRYLLLAMLLLSGCDPHDLDVPRIEDQSSVGDLDIQDDGSVRWTVRDLFYPKGESATYHSNTFKNEGPHAIVLSDDNHCLLLRPGESGTWFGGSEISTPDGYEKEDIK